MNISKKTEYTNFYKNYEDFFTMEIDKKLKNKYKKLKEIQILINLNNEILTNERKKEFNKMNKYIMNIEFLENTKNLYYEIMYKNLDKKTPLYYFSNELIKILNFNYLNKNKEFYNNLDSNFLENLRKISNKISIIDEITMKDSDLIINCLNHSINNIEFNKIYSSNNTKNNLNTVNIQHTNDINNNHILNTLENNDIKIEEEFKNAYMNESWNKLNNDNDILNNSKVNSNLSYYEFWCDCCVDQYDYIEEYDDFEGYNTYDDFERKKNKQKFKQKYKYY